jgi:hypothetical protein
MMESALNDQDVLALAAERHAAAIRNIELRVAVVLPYKIFGQVHALQMSKAELLERMQSSAAAAEDFNQVAISRQPRHAHLFKALLKLDDFLLRRFKPEIRGFPRTGLDRQRLRRSYF